MLLKLNRNDSEKCFREPLTGIEQATFWSPVRRSNPFSYTRTQMAERISYISVNKIYRHIETVVLVVCMSHVRTSTHRSFLSAIWVLVAQWLEYGFDYRLRIRNISLSLRLSLSSKQLPLKLPNCKSFHIYIYIYIYINRQNNPKHG